MQYIEIYKPLDEVAAIILLTQKGPSHKCSFYIRLPVFQMDPDWITVYVFEQVDVTRTDVYIRFCLYSQKKVFSFFLFCF